MIAPGGTEVVQILLVEKDKTMLLQSYNTMGESALETCRDKFLIQSIAVEDPQKKETLANNYEELTTFWTQMTSMKHPGIANKKLPVRHTVDAAAAAATGGSPSPQQHVRHHQTPIDSMSVSELSAELTSLRTKYDELVSFSVNLTAERDMLNNTLEQTKRDLQLAVAATTTSSSGKGILKNNKAMTKSSTSGQSSSSSSRTTMLVIMTLVTALSMGIVLGAKLHQLGLLRKVPILRDHLYNNNDEL